MRRLHVKVFLWFWVGVLIVSGTLVSLTELSHYGLPSVLIPYPAAADDHQSYNARIFERAGAARLMVESKTTPEALHQTVSETLTNSELIEGAGQIGAGQMKLINGAAGRILGDGGGVLVIDTGANTVSNAGRALATVAPRRAGATRLRGPRAWRRAR